MTVDYFGMPEDHKPEKVETETIVEDTQEKQIIVEEASSDQADKMEELEEPVAVKEVKRMISIALNE